MALFSFGKGAGGTVNPVLRTYKTCPGRFGFYLRVFRPRQVDYANTDTDTEIWSATFRIIFPVSDTENVVSIARTHMRHLKG